MSEYMNVVEMEVKDGRLEEWRMQAQKKIENLRGMHGLLDIRWVNTGANKLCAIGRWASKDAANSARPKMIEVLDQTGDVRVDSVKIWSSPVRARASSRFD